MAQSFTVTYEVKRLFFDRKAVTREVGKANAMALSKAGAFVRRRARSSMRRRKKASSPGTPPSVHSADKVATLKNILFAYDRYRQSVVIGPVKLARTPYNVPELHEYGGTVRVRRRARKGKTARYGSARYPARPFMGPALVAEAPKFPSLWASTAGGRAAA